MRRTYEETTENYTGGGKITQRVVENPAVTETYAQRRKREDREARVVAGVEELTWEEKVAAKQQATTETAEEKEARMEEVKTLLAYWKTPEQKAKAEEYAAHHTEQQELEEDF